MLTSGSESFARQNSSAWFLSSWPMGFLSLIKEDWYGSVVNWLENKPFSRIWERGDRKNKEGICLICNFIDSLNVLIHILRLQLLRFYLCLVGLGVFGNLLQRIFLVYIYIYIYIYVPWCIHGDIYILNWKDLTCQIPKTLQHWHFIWNFMCPIKPLESTIFSSFVVSLLLSVCQWPQYGLIFLLTFRNAESTIKLCQDFCCSLENCAIYQLPCGFEKNPPQLTRSINTLI